MSSDTIKLNKSFGRLSIISLALGSIIGWGAFTLPGIKFLPGYGLANTIIGISIGAAMMVVIEKNYGFLIPRFPHAGGEYVYIKNVLGQPHAFITGWFLSIAYISMIASNATAIPLLLRGMPLPLFSQSIYSVMGYDIFLGEILLSCSVLTLFAILNIRGIKTVAFLQTTMALLLFLIPLLLLVAVFTTGHGASLKREWLSGGSSHINISSIIAVIAIAPFLFVGFDSIPQSAEEFNFPPQKVSLLSLFAIIMGALTYIFLNITTAAVFDKDSIEQASWATGEAAKIVLGGGGMVILLVALFSAIIAGVNGFYLSASRLLYGMAIDHSLPPSFGKLHKRYRTPSLAVTVCLLVTLVAPWFGREGLLWIVDMASIGAAIAYGYTSLSAFRLAETLSLKISGGVGTVLGLIFVLILLIPGSPGALELPSLIALVVWIIIGVIFYYFRKERVTAPLLSRVAN